MIAAIALAWLAAVVLLAGRGLRRWWIAALLVFPVIAGMAILLDPSLSGRGYRTSAIAVAAIVWAIGGLASTAAWWMARRRR